MLIRDTWESTVNICLLLVITLNRITWMAGFAAAAGIYYFLHGFHLFARGRSLGHIPASKICGASQGPAAVSGMAIGPYSLTAPITGDRCFLYQTTVWQQSEANRSREWKKVAEETLHLPFFIEDSTGQLLIEPFGAELDLHQDLNQEYGSPTCLSSEDNVPPRVSVFLARHGIEANRPFRIEERSIQAETPLFVSGTIAENPGIPVRPLRQGTDDSRGNKLFREANPNSTDSALQPEIIRLASGATPASTTQMTQQGKIAAALTRAGITKPEAWAAAGVSFPGIPSESVALEERTQLATDSAPQASAITAKSSANDPENDQAKTDPGAGFNLTPPVVLMKGGNDSPFMISCHSQPEIIHSLGWKSVFMVVGGAGLTVLGLYVLLLALHLR